MKQLNRDEIEGLEFNRCFVEDCHIFSDKEYDLFKPRSGNFYIYVDTNSQKECFELEASEVEDWKKLVENQIDVKIKGEGVMKKMENNMFGISLDDTPIYRVVTVERLLEMFRDRKIVLVKPRKWDDPYENFLLNAKGMTPNGEEVDFEQTRERFYGSCWTTTEESDAMWRIYAPDKNGVKIKTTAKKLFREFWEANANISRGLSCFIGKVKYFDEAEIENILRGKEQVKEFFDNLTESSRNQLKTLLIKREEFSHEEEVRLIFRNSNPENANLFGIWNRIYIILKLTLSICLTR